MNHKRLFLGDDLSGLVHMPPSLPPLLQRKMQLPGIVAMSSIFVWNVLIIFGFGFGSLAEYPPPLYPS